MMYISRKKIALSLSLLVSTHAVCACDPVSTGLAINIVLAGGLTAAGYCRAGALNPTDVEDNKPEDVQRTAIPGMAGTYDAKIGSIMRDWQEDAGKDKNENREYNNNMILHGPTGNGKTMLAEKFAEQTGSILQLYHGSSIMNQYANSGPQKLGAIFEDAIEEFKRTGKRVTVCIDEFDAIAKGDPGTAHEHEKTEMEAWQLCDQYKNDNRIFVIIITNDLEKLDARLTRRFTNQIIEIPNPDEKQRKSVFKYFFYKKNKIEVETVCPDNCEKNFIKATKGWNNSDLEDVGHRIKIAKKSEIDEKITPTLIEKMRKAVENSRNQRNKQENEKKDRESLAARRDEAALWHYRAGTVYSVLGSIKFLQDILSGKLPTQPVPSPEPK